MRQLKLHLSPVCAQRKVKCYLNSGDGIARWSLDVGGKISSLCILDLEIQSEGLVESISIVFRELLKREGVLVSEIDELSFILGPGSFTSLRTSYSFLRGLIAPCNIKLIGISSFLAYLLSHHLDSLGQINLSLRANAQENFVADFNLKSKNLIFANYPKAILIEESSSVKFIQLPEILDTQNLILATRHLTLLDSEALNSLTKAGHLYISPGQCELLYIKGVSAKTLVERGIAVS